MKNPRCLSLRATCVVLFFFCLSNPAPAADQFSLGVSAAMTIPEGTSKQLGPGGLASLHYAPWSRVALSLSSGYLAWGYLSTNSVPGKNEKYNIRVIPIILGVRYFFTDEGLRPYVSGELGYSIGKHEYTISLPVPGFPPGSEYSGTRDISEIGPGLGAGFQLPLAQKLKLDLGTSVLLTSQAQGLRNVRILAGMVLGI